MSTHNYWRILQRRFEGNRTKEHYRSRLGDDFLAFERFFEPTGELSLHVAHPYFINRELPVVKNYENEWCVDYFTLKKFADKHGDLSPELEELGRRIFIEEELAGYELNRMKLLEELARTLKLDIDIKQVNDSCLRLGSLSNATCYLHYGDRTQLAAIIDLCQMDASGCFCVIFTSYTVDTELLKPIENIQLESINDFVNISKDGFVMLKSILPKTPILNKAQSENTQKVVMPFAIYAIHDDGITVIWNDKNKRIRSKVFGSALAKICKEGVFEAEAKGLTRDNLKNDDFLLTYFRATTRKKKQYLELRT